MNNRCLMQPDRHEFNGQTNSSKKHINNVLLIGYINLTNALQNDLSPGCRIQTIRSNRYRDLVKSINNLPKFNCYIICFSFYNNVENEILSIINAIKNKNRNVFNKYHRINLLFKQIHKKSPLRSQNAGCTTYRSS